MVACDLAKVLSVPLLSTQPRDKTVYPFIAMSRLDFVISVGTISTEVFFTRLAALSIMAKRVIAYSAIEGILKNHRPVSVLTTLASKLHKVSIVTPSNYSKTELQSLGVKVEAIIPHGVDLKVVNSVSNKNYFDRHDEKIKVLSIFSNLYQLRKHLGLYYLLLAWSRLSKNIRKNAILVLKVPNGTRHFVRHLASSLSLKKEEYTIIDTWLSRGSLFCLFNSVNVYVHGTLADAFGIPLIESIACGTPVIALNAEPWKEIVNENTGWLVKVAKEKIVENYGLFTPSHRLRIPEVNDLAFKIATAIQFCEESDYRKLRDRCLKHARMFDIHKTYQKFKKLIG